MTYTLAFEDADPDDVDLLGGKGAGLARLVRLGLRVPPGYVVSTAACREYLASGALPDGLFDEVLARLAQLEARSGKRFGSDRDPLLVSVRSGAPVSMPGMMDTILDLGLDRRSAVAVARLTGSTAFMADLVARFHRMYAETVLGVMDVHDDADRLVRSVAPGDDPDTAFTAIWAACDAAVAQETDERVPAEPVEQLRGAVEAVFRSWNTRRAKTYRDHHGIPHDLGTAVVVQAMVFGNLSADSGSGVVFTRNPATGEPLLYGEFLAASQGEDVVAGTRTPDPLPGAMPAEAFAELEATCRRLEREQGDVLDIEFTVERSRLYFLQVRRAKRTPQAAVRIAGDLLDEGVLDLAGALGAVTLDHVRQIDRPGFDAADVAAARERGDLLTTGTGACPGQVSGVLALTSERARELADAGHDVVLARPVTSPSDLDGMIASQGIVTATGGSTSHAAVVARALGTACVVGASDLDIDVAAGRVRVGDRVLAAGDPVSLDGASGEVFAGAFTRATAASASDVVHRLLVRAEPVTGCRVFARVTLPPQVEPARARGATGLVTAVDDLLAASGRLEKLVQTLMRQGRVTRAVCEELEESVVVELTPLLREAGDLEVGVRAVDFLSDDARELMQQTALLARFPELSMPVGAPDLLRAQLAAVTRAAADSGARAHLSVRHLRDPAEADALRALRAQLPGAVPVGAYLTSPRAVSHLASMVRSDELAWVEVRTVQARMFGIPARQLLTQQPLDDYVRRGLLADPRTVLDPVVGSLFAPALAAAPRSGPDDASPALGARLSGRVSAPMVGALYRLGLRRFAVEVDEVRPALLALGQAATGG
ncbi:pyruvate, phosphate dikinase [Kineosporia sp. A_224]|uniref:pyruvate, phosphate dikinase n=1 Tax=Kineosporia sp. A_224 TaxID=1962180 RepID=UPI000B4C136A|nr:pyruvate, phosphate dikinase [Kineosporia sp. A_224]